MFPASNNAKDIVNVFTQLCNELGQTVYCNAEVKAIKAEHDRFDIIYEREGEQIQLKTQKVVIASGGLPISKMGATDFGLRIARQFGINITETAPALVPLTITGKDAEWFAELSGNTVFCAVSNDRITFEENILFTHWGLSGPAILQISSYWRPGEWINIDLLPGKDIVKLIMEERESNGKKQLLSFLSALYSRKFAAALEKFLPIDKNLATLTKADLDLIHAHIHHFRVKPAGDKGYDKAEVMRGGVDTNELSSKTLESKKIPGLYFGGECVDVTGWLGGYNFQWAWASGVAAGAAIE